jgi:hypothetical protein
MQPVAHDGVRDKSVVRICMIVENHWRAVMGGAPYQGRVIAECLAARPDFEVFYLARRCRDDVQEDGYTVVRVSGTWYRRRAVFDARSLGCVEGVDPM